MGREAGQAELLEAGARVLQVLEREVGRVSAPLWNGVPAQRMPDEGGAGAAQAQAAEAARVRATCGQKADRPPGVIVPGQKGADDTDHGQAAGPSTRTVAGFVTVAGRVDQVGVARAFARRLLDGCPLLEEALLVVSELVSNSVQHSHSSLPGGTVTLYVLHVGARVRVEVRDDGAGGVPCMRPAGSEAFPEWAGDLDEVDLRGRGLRLVDEVATCWGFAIGHRRTTTWAELCPEPLHEALA
ncbi:hypothetical protein Sme01_06830 [Sphaerisporangium melleum]|uniref:Histidine kinase/HSP90-like ATPase domain-containing protein n=1 Tax=Sphaerisporangium melleum TaxID=321316 RepID=A0A917QWV0_9ACTN|nr:ATP-binding protein [Sphaerisporangium melleum]GGK73473.1 hypothetical protein GCM10007964_15370 [Sphaerisporangium melleum]GII68207.1 hypothetical protein Sme01_06830 [Sphaerisporangium melleum]